MSTENAPSRARLVFLAITIGIAISAVLQVLALVAYQNGLVMITRILDWPNTLVQAAIACAPDGSADQQSCEGTPLNVLAYFASLPLGAAVYGAVAYIRLRKRWFRGA
jgi:hypothetical protein